MEYRAGDEVREFVNRTRDNLEAIRALKKENPATEVWEFTQLINSMLGLLVFPQQRYIDSIPRTPLADLRNHGWPIPSSIEGDFEPDNLHDLFRMLRNGIAHFNVEFDTNDGQLCGLRIWNCRDNRINWKVKLSEKDLEMLTEKFVATLLETVPTKTGA